MEAIGGHGEYVERPEELKPALERAISFRQAGLRECAHPLRTEPANPQSGSPTETVLASKRPAAAFTERQIFESDDPSLELARFTS